MTKAIVKVHIVTSYRFRERLLMFKTHDGGHTGVGVIIFIHTTVAAINVCTLVPMLALALPVLLAFAPLSSLHQHCMYLIAIVFFLVSVMMAFPWHEVVVTITCGLAST